MLPTAMSTSTTISEEASVSSGAISRDNSSLNPLFSSVSSHAQLPPTLNPKKKRNQPGNPDPDAEVVALSPRTLMATNRFVCEVCRKGFQRDQNLQLHRRGHNLPWKLRQRDGNGAARKKVYVCPDASCVHHHPSRALGDLTGIKKHYWRKHGEKKWRCDKCSKMYAVMSDWKAHAKTCGTREYRCDCGTIFSRKDSFATHRAFCDALAQESARITAAMAAAVSNTAPFIHQQHPISWDSLQNPNPSPVPTPLQVKTEDLPLLYHNHIPSSSSSSSIAAPTHHLSATALLQKAATAGHLANTSVSAICGSGGGAGLDVSDFPAWQRSDCLLTRDFLGVAEEAEEEMLSFTGSTGGLGGGGGGGSMDFMAPLTAASCDRASHASAITDASKREAAPEFGLHHHTRAASAASQAWWRLLE